MHVCGFQSRPWWWWVEDVMNSLVEGGGDSVCVWFWDEELVEPVGEASGSLQVVFFCYFVGYF